jgi:hypothetical protein
MAHPPFPDNLDVGAAVEVRHAEDLSHTDVTPLLEALTASGVWRVRSERVAWSGPAAGGIDVGLLVTTALAGGGLLFAKTFMEELARDAYAGVRSAIRGLAVALRDRAGKPSRVRASVPVAIEVGAVRFYFGSLLEHRGDPDEWSDPWFLQRLVAAQAIVEGVPEVVLTTSVDEVLWADEFTESDAFEKKDAGYHWNSQIDDWNPDGAMIELLKWGDRIDRDAE